MRPEVVPPHLGTPWGLVGAYRGEAMGGPVLWLELFSRWVLQQCWVCTLKGCHIACFFPMVPHAS